MLIRKKNLDFKKLLKFALIILIVLFSIVNVQCSKPTEPNKKGAAKKVWQSVPELSGFSVRYIIQHDGYLYLSAVNFSVPFDNKLQYYAGERGLVYRTSDGQHWEKVFGIRHEVGPFAVLGDTLYLHCDDSVYSFHPKAGWKPKYKCPGRLKEAKSIGDMVFLGNNLYMMQSLYNSVLETYRINPDGKAEEIKGYYGLYSYAGTKFLKVMDGGNEKVYVRGAYIGWGFWTFDGSLYTKVMNGLTPGELEAYNPTNSMAYRSDTLFAAFKNPASIKILINNVWQPYSDSLPYSESSLSYSPVLKPETTAITFVDERMFVSTQCLGVLEYKKSEGWVRMSDGLRVIPEVEDGRVTDLWEPVVFLESFKGYLIAAYGRPAYAPWETSRENTGLFIYNLQ